MPESRVAVTSRSFSRHPVLRAELAALYPNARFNDDSARLAGDDLAAFLAGAERAVIALERIDGALLDRLPDLKVISKYGVGVDMLDLAALAERGVRLGWTGGVNKRSVSELVIACAISLLRHLPEVTSEVRAGVWRQTLGRQISGRCFGIVGCGHVGKDLGRLLRAFGCRVLAYDILDFPDYYAETGVEPATLETLLATAEIVTLHLPLDDATRNLMSAERLQAMRPGGILINAARGGLVDEPAVRTLLKSGHLAAAAFDVLACEPPTDLTLAEMPNVIVTPHIGGSAEEAILNMGRAAIAGLEHASVPRPGTEYWPA